MHAGSFAVRNNIPWEFLNNIDDNFLNLKRVVVVTWGYSILSHLISTDKCIVITELKNCSSLYTAIWTWLNSLYVERIKSKTVICAIGALKALKLPFPKVENNLERKKLNRKKCEILSLLVYLNGSFLACKWCFWHLHAGSSLLPLLGRCMSVNTETEHVP